MAESAIGEIKSLNDTRASILRNKAALEVKRDRLLQELNQVNQAIDTADHDLSQIPPAFTRLEEDKQKYARQAYQLHKSLRPISGSSVDNNQVIENIDQICLRAIKVIREAQDYCKIISCTATSRISRQLDLNPEICLNDLLL